MTSLRSLVVFISLTFLAPEARSADPPSVRIRAMTSNLSSGNRQSYDGGEGARILRGLKPDVVLMQEFNYGQNSEAEIKSFVAKAFGKDFSYYREHEKTDQISNGVISRYPIRKSGEWEDKELGNRDFAWARIDIPGDRDLWAISVHLSNKSEEVREKQANRLVSFMRDAIPEGDFVLLGGDLNVETRTALPIRILANVVAEKDAPKDSKGKTETNSTGSKNYDWLLADADLLPLMVPVTFIPEYGGAPVEGKNQFSSGLVFNSLEFPNLAAVPPIEKGDSKAKGMQHLAVVKDFLIPINARN